MTDPSSTIGSRIAEKSGWREISGPLFRKYVALFLAVVCVALLSNGVFEIWFSYQEHRASFVGRRSACSLIRFVEEQMRQTGGRSEAFPHFPPQHLILFPPPPGNREIFQEKQGGNLSANGQSLREMRHLDNFSKSE
jgi:hypothetical protein